MKDENNSKYYTFFSDKLFNIISLFDSDIGTVIFLFIIFILFFDPDNIISKFLNHKFWRIISIPYWSNLLLLHAVSTFVFYFSENRIKLILSSIIFISFQILIFLIFFSCLFFVLIEMPFKNINQNITAIFDKKQGENTNFTDKSINAQEEGKSIKETK